MEKRQFGTTDMEITPIGFGAWAIGGPWRNGWGPQDDDDSIATIHRAIEQGINWIDTAAIYGRGHSEEVVARALEGVSDRPYVFTKCSRVWDAQGNPSSNLKRDSIRKECEDSLRRLRVEVIDLYQVHWPRPEEDLEEGWSAVAELQQEGKVHNIGVSNFNVSQLQRAQSIAPVATLQPPYSLVKPDAEQEILPYCLEQNIGVIVYSPMQSGLLSGKMTRERAAAFPDDDHRSRNPEFQEPKLSRNLELAELLGKIGARYGRSAGEVAIAWTLHNPAVTGAIVGARRPDQVDGVVGAAEFRLSDDEIAEIETVQHSEEDVTAQLGNS